MSLGIDAATNRVIGATYDANGNQQPSAATNHYDWENRLLYNGTESYFYDFQNRRVYKHTPAGGMQWTFYGIDGRRLVTARWDWVAPPYTVLTEMSRNIYFAGKLIRTGGDSVVRDRLGSVRYRKNGGVTERLDYFPYGEEKPGATAQAREKFATYFRDATGLDYADQRYFNSQHGRFLTPDPYESSAGASAPQSWNRYSYVEGDTLNFYDPNGTIAVPVGTPREEINSPRPSLPISLVNSWTLGVAVTGPPASSQTMPVQEEDHTEPEATFQPTDISGPTIPAPPPEPDDDETDLLPWESDTPLAELEINSRAVRIICGSSSLAPILRGMGLGALRGAIIGSIAEGPLGLVAGGIFGAAGGGLTGAAVAGGCSLLGAYK